MRTTDPMTDHGRTTLESAWQEITLDKATKDHYQKTIALALVSIALSLRKIANTMSSVALKPPL
jgi:hypothetical protein